jgi:5-methylcytosine-specific restriction endonuclease McrA
MKWAATNTELVAASKLDYYERKREEIIARSRKWAKDNPEKVARAKADNRRKRRAAKLARRGSFTSDEFKALCESYGNKCLACGDGEAALEADHVVPLTKGGSDDISKIQPLCGFCNRKKFVNTIDYRPLLADACQATAREVLSDFENPHAPGTGRSRAH